MLALDRAAVHAGDDSDVELTIDLSPPPAKKPRLKRLCKIAGCVKVARGYGYLCHAHGPQCVCSCKCTTPQQTAKLYESRCYRCFIHHAPDARSSVVRYCNTSST